MELLPYMAVDPNPVARYVLASFVMSTWGSRCQIQSNFTDVSVILLEETTPVDMV